MSATLKICLKMLWKYYSNVDSKASQRNSTTYMQATSGLKSKPITDSKVKKSVTCGNKIGLPVGSILGHFFVAPHMCRTLTAASCSVVVETTTEEVPMDSCALPLEPEEEEVDHSQGFRFGK